MHSEVSIVIDYDILFSIDIRILDFVSNFADLGLILHIELNFHLQVHASVNKPKVLLGFIKRWSFEFKDPYISERLFTVLVRPILENSILVWPPTTGITWVKSRRCKRLKLLKFPLHGLGWSPAVSFPPYENRLKLMLLSTLASRHAGWSVSFVIRFLPIIGVVHDFY